MVIVTLFCFCFLVCINKNGLDFECLGVFVLSLDFYLSKRDRVQAGGGGEEQREKGEKPLPPNMEPQVGLNPKTFRS